MLGPRRKVAHFTIVAVVCEPHLWPDEQNLAVVDDEAAVVDDILVYHGPEEGERLTYVKDEEARE